MTGRFYFRLYKASVRARLQYRLDLAISIATALMTQASALAFYWLVFANTEDLSGWKPSSVLLLFGVVAMTFGVSELFFNGVWSLPAFIATGRLDRALVSPASNLFFVLISQPQLHAIGNLLAGLGMLVVAASQQEQVAVLCWLLPLWVISGALTYTAVLVILAALSFAIVGPYGDHLRLAIQLLNATRYPLRVYPTSMRCVLIFLVPLGVGSHMSGMWLDGRASLGAAALIPVLVAFAACACAAVAWEVGVRRYQSTGS